MDRNYFIKLLQKYSRGETTKEEEKFLESYDRLFEYEPDVLEQMQAGQKDTLRKEIRESVWQKIASRQQPTAKIRRMNAWRAAASVAAVLLIVCAGWLTYSIAFAGRMITVSSKAASHLVALPDGSTITLNNGSKVSYSSNFNGSEKREVYLDGEAFFDVSHNAARPFIVYAGKLNVTVLGTAFDVRAFPVDADITVTVKRGKVRVSDSGNTLGTIVPQQQIVYNKLKGTAMLQVVSNEDYINWKEQDITFNNVTVAEAAAILEERFNVKIVINDNVIRNERFTASFAVSETLDHVLKTICEFNGAAYHYGRNKSTITITHK